MPKSKEYLSSSDSDSDESPRPKKKAKKEEKKREDGAAGSSGPKKNAAGEVQFSLGKKKYVTVRKFKGTTYVDIREYYMDGDGNEKPGKKGICLSVEQWHSVKGHMDDIDQAVKSV